MKRIFCLIWGLSVSLIVDSFGQCVTGDFSAKAVVCRGEMVAPINLSAPGAFLWDFCSGDFNQSPNAANSFTLNAALGAPRIEFAKDGGKWFGFVTSTWTNALYRMEFANGTSSPPTFTENLGNLSGALDGPSPVRIIQEGNQWYCLILNINSRKLLMLSLGDKLSNTFTQTVLYNSPDNVNSGMAVAKDSNDGWTCILSLQTNQFAVIRLGNLGLPPGPSDVITTPSVPDPNSLGDVDLINECGTWYGFATNYGNGNVYRLNFGSSLFSTPAISKICTIPTGNPTGLKIAREGENYFLFLITLDGSLLKVTLANDLASIPVIVAEGNPGNVLPVGSYGLGLAKENSVWSILTLNALNGSAYNIIYPNICSASPQTSTLVNPQVTYAAAGSFGMSLDYISAFGTSAKTRPVIVTSSVAPDIDFTSSNYCVQNFVNFSSQNSSANIISYDWNFGDAGTQTISNPSHTYSISGIYDVTLKVGSSNGCNNSIVKSLQIFDPPSSDFTMPAANPVCTNQSYSMVNTSSFDPASNPSWEWRLNGILLSTQKDFTTQFSLPIAQDLRLKAIIPGCSNEMIKTIATVKTGPVVDFSVNDNCQGTAVLFANGSTGADAGYLWSFGDGNTSAATNPSHPYAAASTFQATLVASNALGCQNFLTKPVRIYSLPVPDFSVGLPPFSCANALTPIQNTTLPLTDSNITNWSWQFNDVTGGTSTQQNPSYTFTTSGNFNVILTATSDKGCLASTTKGVTISPSPSADFTAGPSCLNQSTAFTDLSSGGVVSRLWQVGTSTFSTANPSYTFVTSGNFPVTLSVTGPNACSSVKTKNITVPVLPVLDYSVSNPCAGQNATFTDVTSSPQDAIVGWNWNFDGDAVTGNPAKYDFSPSGVFNVKMTTTHASGCRYTLSRNVPINPSPLASFTASPDRGASPLIVQFVSTPQPAASYSWKFFDKTVSTSTLASPVHTFLALGDYSAELTVSNGLGCSDVKSMPIHVLIPSIDLIMKDYSLVSDPVTGKLKSSVTILNNSNIPVSSAEVALFLSEKAVVNETISLNLDPGQSAVRTLSFTLSPDQFEFTFLCAEVLSEKDMQGDNNKRCINLGSGDYFISPYPNPASGQVHIDWIAPRSGDSALITIYDSMGRKSYEWQTLSEAGLNQTIHDLTYLAAGMYYVTIETGGLRKTTRFLRQ